MPSLMRCGRGNKSSYTVNDLSVLFKQTAVEAMAKKTRKVMGCSQPT